MAMARECAREVDGEDWVSVQDTIWRYRGRCKGVLLRRFRGKSERLVQQLAGQKEGDVCSSPHHNLPDHPLLCLGLHRSGHGSAAFQPHTHRDAHLHAHADSHLHPDLDATAHKHEHGHQYTNADGDSHCYSYRHAHGDGDLHSHEHSYGDGH